MRVPDDRRRVYDACGNARDPSGVAPDDEGIGQTGGASLGVTQVGLDSLAPCSAVAQAGSHAPTGSILTNSEASAEKSEQPCDATLLCMTTRPSKTGPMSIFALTDVVRRAQGNALDLLGFGPSECSYRVIASAPNWRLRDYGGSLARPPLLIIAAPIKRPYIWDLAPSVSVVRYCLHRGLRVYLLEWKPPPFGDGSAGLETYGDRAIAECVARISAEQDGQAPFLIGHSLGGTLAATFAALDPQCIRGLVLLGAPLSFQPGSSKFRDAVVALAPSLSMETGIVPGSAVSQFSALASPSTFIWSRVIDATLSLPDIRATEIHTRVERWALDEVALPGMLVRQVLRWFYQENRLCQGTLRVRDRTVGPSTIRVPTLAVVNAADEIAPRASVKPFLDQIPGRDVRLLEFPGETGVGMQHLAILVGSRAHAEVWPDISDWLDAHG
jgi:polyhydroxyalkanoate synthase